MVELLYLCVCCVVSIREGNEKSYQLLRDSLDLYLTINPDNVQYLLLQARLYFHLGIWPEKVVTQNILLRRDLILPFRNHSNVNQHSSAVLRGETNSPDLLRFALRRRCWTSCSTFRHWIPPSTGQWATWCSTHWSISSTRDILQHLRSRDAVLQNTWRSSIQSASS